MNLILAQPIAWSAESISEGTASWYSRNSCVREGTSGIMACGEKLNDEAFTCASWFFDLGSRVKVTMLNGNCEKSIICFVKDRGPSERLVRKGRIIDLTPMAFSKLAPLTFGVIKVKVEKVNE